MRLHHVIVALAPLVAGCGAQVTTIDDLPSTSEPPMSDPEAPPSPPPTEPPDGRRVCPAAQLDASEPLFALTSQTGVTLVRADGEQRQLVVGAMEAPPDVGFVKVTAQGNGAWLSTVASWTRSVGGAIEAYSIVTLFDQSGEEMHQYRSGDYAIDSYGTNPEGDILLSRYSYASLPTDYVVLKRSGEIVGLGQWQPSGWVGGNALRGRDAVGRGWRDIDSGVVTRAAHTENAVHVMRFQDGFLSIHEDMEAPLLWFDGPSGSERVVLQGIDPAEAVHLWSAAANGTFVLLVNNENGMYYRVALPDGVVTPVDLAPPMGGPPAEMSYCTPRPALDHLGNVIFAGGGDELTFMLNEPVANTWSVLGGRVAEVETMVAGEVDGTYLLEGVVDTFCPGAFGSPATNALDGQSLQLVRPSSGAERALPLATMGSVAVRAGGACVAYAEEDGLWVLDLDDGSEVRFEQPGGVSWWVHR